MKLLILYRPNSEHDTQVQSFVRDFQRQYDAGRNVQMVSLDSREGADTARLYDVVSYPAILVIGDNGALVALWQGTPLPLMDEVAGYAHTASSR